MVIVAGVVIGVWGLFSIQFQNEKLFWVKNIITGEPAGPFINTLHFAHFMALCIPLTLGLWLGAISKYFSKGQKISFLRLIRVIIVRSFIFLIPAFLMCIAMLKALSRGAFLALIFSLGVFLILLVLKKNTKKKALLVIVGILFFVLLFFLFGYDQNILERIRTLSNPLQTASGTIRLSLWNNTIRIFKDFPLWGIGLNAFQSVFCKYKTVYGSGKMYFTHCENDYIETFAETGIFAAIALFALVGIFLFHIIRHYLRENDKYKSMVLAGSISSIFAAMIGGFSDFIFHIPLISFVFMLVCFIAWPERLKREIIIDRKSLLNKIVVLVSVLVSILIIVISSRTFCAQLFFNRYLAYENDYDISKKHISQAAFLDPGNAYYSFLLGRFNYREAKKIGLNNIILSEEKLLSARQEFQRAIDLEPTLWKHHYYLGSTDLLLASTNRKYSNTKFIENAERQLDYSLDLNPTRYDVYGFLGEYYLPIDIERSFYYYKKQIELRPWKVGEVLRNVWGVSQDPQILQKVVPNNLRSMINYAEFLKTKKIDPENIYDQFPEIVRYSDLDTKILAIGKLKKEGYYQKATDILIMAINNIIGKENIEYYYNFNYNTDTNEDKFWDKQFIDIKEQYMNGIDIYEQGRYEEAFRAFSHILQNIRRSAK